MPKTAKKSSPTSREEQALVDSMIGASGTHFFKGFYNIYDPMEYVTDLQGQGAIEVYNRMRRSDAQVRLALLALTNPIVNAEWSIIPAGDPEKKDNPSAKEEEAAKVLNQYWFDDEFQWEQTLRQILSFFWAGFSVFEKGYSYDGTFIKPRVIEQRLPNTIVEWDVKDGRLERVLQYISAGDTARQVWIPSEKLLVFSFDREGNDYRGQSVLRAAYKHYYYKDTFYRIQAMKIERWSLGIPKIMQTAAILNQGGKSAAIEMAKNLRAHEQAYAFVPQGYELELLDGGTGKMVDEQPAIDHHNKSILKAVMAQFLELGIEDTGSRAVGTTLKDFYLQGLSFAANYICEIIKQQCFKEWTSWNFGDGVRPPSLRFEGIQPDDLKLLAEAYGTISNSSAIEMDDPTEEFFRTQLGLPKKDMATARKKAPDPLMPENDDVPDEDPDDEGETTGKPKAGDPKKGEPPKGAKPAKQNLKASYPEPYVPQGMEADTWIHFNRPLRPSEENVALREIVGRLDDTKEKMVKATREVRAAVVDQLVKQIDQYVAKKDPLKAQKIDYSSDLANQLRDGVSPLLQDLMEYGRQQVHREIIQQKKIKAKADPLDALKKMARSYLAAKAQQFTEISLDKLVDEARKQAALAIRTGVYDIGLIRDQLEQFSENTVRKSAGYSVNEAFGFGRREGAEELKEQIAYAEYSSVLDSNTCFNCQDLDGSAWELDSPEYVKYSPPLYNCEGGSQCRCIWVYVAREERPAQA